MPHVPVWDLETVSDLRGLAAANGLDGEHGPDVLKIEGFSNPKIHQRLADLRHRLSLWCNYKPGRLPGAQSPLVISKDSATGANTRPGTFSVSRNFAGESPKGSGSS